MRRLSLLVLAAALCQGAEPLEGRWEGTVQIPASPLNAVIDLAQNGGQWVGSGTVPGFTKGSPLTEIVVQPPAVSFTLKGALGDPKFSGRLDAGTLAGNFTQGGNTAAFALRRSGPPQVDLPRQSTAVAANLEGEWVGEVAINGNKLKATLKLTNRAGGAAEATFVVVGKRETKIPVDLVRQDGEFVSVVSSLYRISFEGRLGKETGELTGTFSQGPMESVLTFRRPQ